MPRHTKPAPPREPSLDDKLHVEAIDHAMRGVVVQLRRAYDGRPARQIGQLVREEIRNIASDAVGHWVAKRCEQYKRERPAESLDDWITKQPILG